MVAGHAKARTRSPPSLAPLFALVGKAALTMTMDLLIRNTRLPQRSNLVDIGVEDGVFSRIGTHLRGNARREIDAEGRLISPPLIDSHVHLDAALTVGQPR